jgi:hypothetical protein
VALAGDEIAGGVVYEHYPKSRCGIVTYLVVAPELRGQGLGHRLLDDAARTLDARGARVVFAEALDPHGLHAHGALGIAQAEQRIARFQRWGARVLATRYVQPSLGPGLPRDRGLRLLALAGSAPLPSSLPGGVVRAFLTEFYTVTEGRLPDAELQAVVDEVPSGVSLIELVHSR